MSVISLLCLIVLANLAFADLQVSSISVSPTTIRPGNTGSVSFTLTNTGLYGVTGVTIYPTGSGFTFTSDKVTVGSIGASGSTPVSLQFRVSPDSTSGVYSIMVNAYWNDNTVSGGTGSKLIQIPVTVSKQTIFKVYSNPTDVSIGGDFNLPVKIENTGGKAKNVVIAMGSSYFIAKDSASLLIGEIDVGQTKELTIPISTIQTMPAGVYSIPVTISYQDELGNIQEASTTLGTVQAVKGFVDFTVVPSLEPASPGKKIKMVISVRNDGTLLAHTVRCSVSSSSSNFLPIGSSQKLVGDIMPGASASVTYDLSINAGASPGYYPVILSFDFLNKQGEAQTAVSKTIGVEVVGEPKLTVIASTTPSPVVSGGRYSLGIQVSNVGTTDVKSLSVSVRGDSITVLENSDTTFIGNLKMDDYSQVTYNVLVKKDAAPGRYPITVTMRFMDAYNNEKEVVETSYLQVVSPEVAAASGNGNGGGMDIWMVLFILLVLAAVAYFAYKKFFKKNNNKK